MKNTLNLTLPTTMQTEATNVASVSLANDGGETQVFSIELNRQIEQQGVNPKVLSAIQDIDIAVAEKSVEGDGKNALTLDVFLQQLTAIVEAISALPEENEALLADIEQYFATLHSVIEQVTEQSDTAVANIEVDIESVLAASNIALPKEVKTRLAELSMSEKAEPLKALTQWLAISDNKIEKVSQMRHSETLNSLEKTNRATAYSQSQQRETPAVKQERQDTSPLIMPTTSKPIKTTVPTDMQVSSEVNSPNRPRIQINNQIVFFDAEEGASAEVKGKVITPLAMVADVEHNKGKATSDTILARIQQILSLSQNQATPETISGATLAEKGPIATKAAPIPVAVSAANDSEKTLPQLSVQPTIQHAAWGRVLANRVAWMANEQIQQASLSLNPKALGPVEVKLQLQHDMGSVSFIASHPATREALEQALPRLRESFLESGLTLIEANVSDNAHQQTKEDDAPEQHFHSDEKHHDQSGEKSRLVHTDSNDDGLSLYA